MDTIGLAKGTVRLEPHNPGWHTLFLQEANLLYKKLGVDAGEVQHVGSTSIPGIPAKPVIDIAVRVDSLQIAETWAEPLAELGYWYKGKQPGMPDRRFFAKGPETKRTVYLHVVNDQEYKKLIYFRDTLRHDEQLASGYAALKQALANAHANDRARYSQSKNEFIQDVLAKRTHRSASF